VKKKRVLPGVNIQWPISQEILSGSKTVETRTYRLPIKYENTELAIIETPGPQADFKARIVGTIIFEGSFQYQNKKDFYADFANHRVDRNSPWAWKTDKPKWGWKIKSILKFDNPVTFKGTKGIVFSKSCKI